MKIALYGFFSYRGCLLHEKIEYIKWMQHIRKTVQNQCKETSNTKINMIIVDHTM